MTGAVLPFDREFGLAELLRAVPRAKLEAALTHSAGALWRIVDAAGVVLLESGSLADGGASAPLRLDFELVGTIEGPAGSGDALAGAARWLEMVLASSLRYRMAADLHLEAVHADYEALQVKHAQLQASELRYRELAAQLEQRVEAQVEVIGRTQRELYRSAKLASIGSLAAGMAHEINNPVGFVRSNLLTAATYLQQLQATLHAYAQGEREQAGLLWQKHDIDFVLADFAGLIEESAGGADRITRIVAKLKAYASAEQAPIAMADPNEAFRAAIGVASEQLPPDARLETDLQPLGLLMCDRAGLQLALLSLLQNASQALGSNGGLIRATSCVAGDAVRLTVSDTGSGIAETVRGRIFDPFFTTRAVGQGMGLGLTVCNDIVRAHRGRVDVDSAVGQGSTFTIYLPLGGASGALDSTP